MKTRIILFFTVTAICSIAARAQKTGTVKELALQVLKTKCNHCHRTRNPDRVFNATNMDRHQTKIYQQVFIFRRMPKGKIRLTEAESQALLGWIENDAQ